MAESQSDEGRSARLEWAVIIVPIVAVVITGAMSVLTTTHSLNAQAREAANGRRESRNLATVARETDIAARREDRRVAAYVDLRVQIDAFVNGQVETRVPRQRNALYGESGSRAYFWVPMTGAVPTDLAAQFEAVATEAELLSAAELASSIRACLTSVLNMVRAIGDHLLDFGTYEDGVDVSPLSGGGPPPPSKWCDPLGQQLRASLNDG